MGSEYRNKFRSFSDYVYVDGRFAMAAAGDTTDSCQRTNGQQLSPWHSEVTELRMAANRYKVRGWGKETALPHLTQLYNACENVLERNIITALSLDTLQPEFLRRTRFRATSSVDGSRSRQRSQPPVSRQLSRANQTPRSELHKRPNSAQQMYPAGAVDCTDGKKNIRAGSSRGVMRSSMANPVPNKDANNKEHKTKTKAASTPRNVNNIRAVSAKTTSPREVNKSLKNTTKLSDNDSAVGNTKRAPKGEEKATRQNKTSSSPRARSSTNKTKENATNDVPADTSATTQDASASSHPKNPPVEPASHEARDFTQQEKEIVQHQSSAEPTRMRSPDKVSSVTTPDPVNWSVPLETGRMFTVTQHMPTDNGNKGKPLHQEEYAASSAAMMTSQMGMNCSFYPDGDDIDTHSKSGQDSWALGEQEHVTSVADEQPVSSQTARSTNKENFDTTPETNPQCDQISISSNMKADSAGEMKDIVDKTGNVDNSVKPDRDLSTEIADKILSGGSAFCFSPATDFARERHSNGNGGSAVTSAVGNLLVLDGGNLDTSNDSCMPTNVTVEPVAPPPFVSQNLFGSAGLPQAVPAHVDKPTYRVV